MAHELRELLHEAAVEPDGDLDVDDLRRRGRRARRRRRLATAGSAAVVVVLLAAGLLVGVKELSGPPDVAVEDGRPGLPDVDRQVVAEGTFDGNLGSWELRAWTQDGDELCLQSPLGTTCARLHAEAARPFLVSSVGTGERDGMPVGCAVGAARPRVATIEVAFDRGTSQRLTPDVNDAFGLRFYATCWTGQRPRPQVSGLYPDEQPIASRGPVDLRQARLLDPTTLALGVASCGGEPEVSVLEETDSHVRIEVVSTLYTSADFCRESIRVELDSPLGDHNVLDVADGQRLAVSHPD